MNFLAYDMTKNGVRDDNPTDGPSCRDPLGGGAVGRPVVHVTGAAI